MPDDHPPAAAPPGAAAVPCTERYVAPARSVGRAQPTTASLETLRKLWRQRR
jgi:hypothetical protein